jgi:hypothetical protein
MEAQFIVEASGHVKTVKWGADETREHTERIRGSTTQTQGT